MSTDRELPDVWWELDFSNGDSWFLDDVNAEVVRRAMTSGARYITFDDLFGDTTTLSVSHIIALAENSRRPADARQAFEKSLEKPEWES